MLSSLLLRTFPGRLIIGSVVASAFAQSGPGIQPGDILVADYFSGPEGNGRLFCVNRLTGERRVITDFDDPNQGPISPGAFGVAVPDLDTILMVDSLIPNGILLHVNPVTGFRTVLSDFSNPLQGPLGVLPVGVAVIQGQTLVSDRDAGTDGRGALFRVNRTTGHRTLVSDFGNPGQGPLGSSPHQIAREMGGAILVVDSDSGTNQRGALFRIDPATGVRTLVSDFGDAAQGPLGSDPGGVTQGAIGVLLVGDTGAGSGGAGALFTVNPLTGVRTVLSDFGDMAKGPTGLDPFHVMVGVDGAILVVDAQGGTDLPDDGRAGGNGALFAVNRNTGARVLLSDFGNIAQGPTGIEPAGIAVVPFTEPDDLIIGAVPIGGPGLLAINPETGLRRVVSNFGQPEQGPTAVNVYDVAVTREGDLLAVDSLGGGVYVVDPVNGARTQVSHIGNAAQGPTGSGLRGVAPGPDGDILISTSNTFTTTAVVMSVNPKTGMRTPISDFGNPALGLLGQFPEDLEMHSSNEILVVDFEAISPTTGASDGLLFKVNMATGHRTVVSDFNNPAQGTLGVDPIGLAQQLDGQVLIADRRGSPTASSFGVLFRVDPATGVRTVISDFAILSQGPGRVVREVLSARSNEIFLLDDLFDSGGKGALLRVEAVTGARTVISNFADTTQGPTLISAAGLAQFSFAPAAPSEPSVSDGMLTTNEDTAASGTLVASDPNGAALTFSIVTNGALGTAAVTNAANGAYTYTPLPNASGTDIFTFKASNGSDESNIAMVTVTITPVNDAPLASDGVLAATAGAAISDTLTATDVDNDPLAFSLVSLPTQGSVVITNAATGAFTYPANANAIGADSFTFQASDGGLLSNIATVNVTIAGGPGNQPPVAMNGAVTTQEDKSVSGVLRASDPEGTKVTYMLVANGTKGTATLTNASNGRFTYVPFANVHGTDSFTFQASDGASLSNVATIDIAVTPVNDAPVATSLAVATTMNTPVIGQLTASDVEGDPLTFAPGKGRGPKRGTVVVLPTGQFTYTPDSGITGSDSFSFQVSDGTASATGTVTVTIGVP